MGSVSKGIADVYRKLAYPVTPPEGVVAEYLLEVLDRLVTELCNTDQTWYINTKQLTLTANRDTYGLDEALPSFGKVHFVYSVFNDGTSSTLRIPIDVVEYDKLIEHYQQPYFTAGQPPNLVIGRRAVSFIYDIEAGNQAVFSPMPQATETVQIVYEPDVQRPGAKADTLFRFSQFDGYVSDSAAFEMLPHCTWLGLDDAGNMAKQSMLRAHLGELVQRGDELFRRWKRSSRNVTDYQRKPFGESRWR